MKAFTFSFCFLYTLERKAVGSILPALCDEQPGEGLGFRSPKGALAHFLTGGGRELGKSTEERFFACQKEGLSSSRAPGALLC